MRVYVASSWRNERQPEVVAALRAAGFDAYDFRNPYPGERGLFSWSEIDPEWQSWTPEQFRDKLWHPKATNGFETDMNHLMTADLLVLVMPCGRSAHLEAGHAIGAGKPTAILLADGEPELMYRMARWLCVTMEELIEKFSQYRETHDTNPTT